MLRVLAGVYHNLCRGMNGAEPMNRVDIVAFFERLFPHMGAPVKKGTPAGDGWVASGLIEDGASAPMARRQQVVELAKVITGWTKAAPNWM